jgi:hypothetical protein
MATPEQVIRNFHEADRAFRLKFAAVVARDEFVALPQDVREARAMVECEAEATARAEAHTEFDIMARDREERWIAAHEDMYGIRRAAAAGR